jgi:hypothetical protein
MLDGLLEMGLALIHFATICFDRGHVKISIGLKGMREVPRPGSAEITRLLPI